MIKIWHTRQKGLTLLELLVTIAVIAVVAAIMMPVVSNILPDTKQRVLDQAQEQVDSFVSKWNDLGAYTYNPETITWTGYVDLNGDGAATSDEAVEEIDLNEEQYAVEESHGDSPSDLTEIDYDITPENTFIVVGANPTLLGATQTYDPITFTYLNTSFSVGSNGQQLSPSVSGGRDGKAYTYTGTLPSGVTFDQSTGIFTGPSSSQWYFLISQIDAGDHTCVVTTTDEVKCTGSNYVGQLGDGSTTDSNVPVDVFGLTGARDVSVGFGFTCALIADGTVKCWGRNDVGQLGSGSNVTASTAPTTVPGLTGVSQIATGMAHACALLSDGTVKCWGRNDVGQLGNGSNVNASTPTTVSGITGATQISTDNMHSCALLSDGSVKCWGDNYAGKLGNGSSTNSNIPVSVSGLSNAIQVNAGSRSTCAVLADRTAKCWGMNQFGEFGNGTTTSSTTPVSVSGLTNVRQISGGTTHVCAVLTDGTAKCWGTNWYGELGTGNTTDSLLPVSVVGVSNISEISAAGYSTCVVLTDGTAKCWGYNPYGNLGIGDVQSERGYCHLPNGDGTYRTDPYMTQAQCDSYAAQYGTYWDYTREAPDSLTPVSPLFGNRFGTQPGFPATVEVTVSDASGSLTTSITLTVD